MNKENFDLEIFQSGYEECFPSHSYGPAIRDHYLIHYIHEGSGILKCNNNIYNISKGDAFLIFPNEINYYEADKQTPWKYSWIGFSGKKASTFFNELNIDTKFNPIISFNSTPLCFEEIKEIDKIENDTEIKLLGLLYLMFFQLLKDFKESKKKIYNYSKDYYADKIINYLTKNYSNKITLNEVSKYIGINRTTINEIFKYKYKKTIKSYLLEIRIQKASYYLSHSSLSISEIAYSVGYEDAFQFSKIFKKYNGVSPKEYRKLNTQ